MSKADCAALIALCAALASATGDVIRQRCAQEITDEDVGHLALFWLSVRDSRWWLGAVCAVANYGLQAAALALARGEAATMARGTGHDVVVADVAASNR